LLLARGAGKRVAMRAFRSFIPVLAFVIGLLAVSVPLRAGGLEPLDIIGATGKHGFQVEVVDNDASRAKGLMYRKELAEGRGMLFDFQREQDVSFWMQNTYIPLDMIFIRGDGRILRIHENAEPLSTRMIPSGGPVLGVLEVIGGTARKLGLKPGDQVAHPIFNRR